MEVECLIFTEIALFCVKLKVCLREGLRQQILEGGRLAPGGQR